MVLPEIAPRRIAVFRALQLGDLLCSMPALRALRAAAPSAEIALVGLPWARWFVERYPSYLDDFVEFPGYPGLPERAPEIARIPSLLAHVQARRFDLAIQMHGSGGIVNPLVALFGARRTAGYIVPGEYCPDPEMFLPYPEGEHEVRIHLRLMAFLGAPDRGEHLEIQVSDADRAALASIRGAGDLVPGGYVCVHPGARYPSRRWPPARFAAVADALAARGLRVVVTGTAEERPLSAAVRASMRAPSLDLTGETTLGAFVALIADARLVLCNDTGTSHVAAATGTPSVVVASGSDVARWAPLDRARHRVLWQDMECRPCGHWECPIGHPCATGVAVEAVLAEADTLLADGGGDRTRPARSHVEPAGVGTEAS